MHTWRAGTAIALLSAMAEQSKADVGRRDHRIPTGGYGYGGGGVTEPGEATFGDLGAVVEPNPSASPQAGNHPIASSGERIEYTTDPISDDVEAAGVGPGNASGDRVVERGDHFEKGTGFALARGVGSLLVYGSALFAIVGVLLAALLQFMIAIPVIVLAVGMFYLGKRVTIRSHEKAEEHFAPLRK